MTTISRGRHRRRPQRYEKGEGTQAGAARRRRAIRSDDALPSGSPRQFSNSLSPNFFLNEDKFERAHDGAVV